MEIKISDTRNIKIEQIIALYKANEWSSANKPKELYNALLNSHSLITAWNNDNLTDLEMQSRTDIWLFTIHTYLSIQIIKAKALAK